jgi:putative hydrolase of the HAD superfamily
MHEEAVTRDLIARITRLCTPCDPLPTGYATRLAPLQDIRAVIFDIYGTLLVSGTGDIGLAGDYEDEQALHSAFTAVGIPASAIPRDIRVSELLVRHIHIAQDERRRQGIDFPEVDILGVWKAVLLELARYGMTGTLDDARLRALAIEYECRDNPVWPMPGLREMLTDLRRRGIRLGIVSNAQFYTPLMFRALLGISIEELGFDAALCAWSWQALEGKPSPTLYRQVREQLAGYGITAEQTLYVGNDCLKDIWPATGAGWKTALFAGDARSLRLREDDSRCRGLEPDLVIDNLRQLEGI